MQIGIHTHDDGGLGTANALAAVRAGATQVQGTVNGYGERVGNCNLCTVIPDLQLKMGYRCLDETGLARWPSCRTSWTRWRTWRRTRACRS